jgi:hypothetical protein
VSHRRAWILTGWYRIIDTPDPLVIDGEPCDANIDHDQRVIWISPCVSASARSSLIAQAASQAFRQAMEAAQVVR